MATITTPLTKLFGIKHPVILAGMNVAAGPELAAAVTNAGGLGVIGGVGYTPEVLREQIAEIKSHLKDKNAPFGVDLLLPQVGEGARKTNYDYTGGKLPELIDIIIAEKAKLFVSAVGVPPRWAVDKLHAAGIPVMNMIGAPKHVKKAIAAGVDIICAQGGEGGGHTGDVPTSVLIPKVVDLCKGHKSPLNGAPIYVVAAGGIFDGRGLAMALCYGAQAAWVGTRFVCAKEAGAPKYHQNGVINAGYHDTIRTIIFTGRPMRVLKTDYINGWEEKPEEIKKLTSSGKIPWYVDMEKANQSDKEEDEDFLMKSRPLLMGSVAGAITEVLPAKVIIDDMVSGAIQALKENTAKITVAKL
ncbi:hypothetical protein HDU97_005560 [Phlyctochytrium planicorne]|nr:hypothetical protein HDU97_005560 [Phlyctochytrium planicorne]